nr:MAG TPA: Tor inhibition protein helix, reverse turn, PROTEIN [Caudoviricetes sp.]
MPKLRSLPRAYEIFKEQDPDSALTKNYFRTLVKTGAIPSVRLGKNYLIDIETLDQYIAKAFSGL